MAERDDGRHIRPVAVRATADPGTAGVVDALALTAFATMAELTRVAAVHDLSLTQLRVLAILRDRRVRMSALADHLGLERSTMSGLVDRAAARGLLRRERALADGRVIEVVITPAGADLARRMQGEIIDALSPMAGGLSLADREQLRVLLDRMHADPSSSHRRTSEGPASAQP